MSSDSFIQQLCYSIKEHVLFEKDSRIVAGISGGADSMALLYGLASLNEQHDWNLDIIVAYLDHGLRGQQGDSDKQFVKEHAEQLNLAFRSGAVDVGKCAKESRSTIEESARCQRYEFMKQVATETEASFITVGHHAKDQAETILHRIIRGTGWRGACGMPMKRTLQGEPPLYLVRPLLEFSPESLRNFLIEINIPFREDETNTSNRMTRNRIRHQVLPVLEEAINPAAIEALNRLGTQAQWIHEYIESGIIKCLQDVLTPEGLNTDKLRSYPDIIRSEVLRKVIRDQEVGEQPFGYSHIQSLMELLDSDDSHERILDLPRGVRASRSGKFLKISTVSHDADPWNPVELPCPGFARIDPLDIQLECEITEQLPTDWSNKTPHEEWLDYDALHLPLTIRPRQQGDRMKPLSLSGEKKLSDILQEGGIPASRRDTVPIVCDAVGPIWVVNHRIAHRVRITKKTRRAIRLYAEPLDKE